MHVLVFGDSITQGYDDYEKGGWVNRLFIDISARSDKSNKEYISVFNQGIDGNTTTDVLGRYESEIECRKDPNMVIILDLGGNDAAIRVACDSNTVPLHTFSDNYKALLKIGKRYGQVVCLGLHDSQEVLTESDAIKYNSEIKRLSLENNALFISMKGILSQDYDKLTYDGDHPSPFGHRLIYEQVKDALLEAGIV